MLGAAEGAEEVDMAKNPTFENIPVFYLQNFPGLFENDVIERFNGSKTARKNNMSNSKDDTLDAASKTLPSVK
jgi:hypothetical protein